MFRKITSSPQSSDGAHRGAENAVAPRIEFTRFRPQRAAADAPALSEFVSQLAELEAETKLETKPKPRIGLPKRL